MSQKCQKQTRNSLRVFPRFAIPAPRAGPRTNAEDASGISPSPCVIPVETTLIAERSSLRRVLSDVKVSKASR